MNNKIKFNTLLTSLVCFGILSISLSAKADTTMGTYAQGGTEPSLSTIKATQNTNGAILRANASILSASLANLTPSTSGLPNHDGVDISSYQSWMTQADFNSLKATGVQTVVIKLTEGTTYTNPSAQSQIQMAKNAGLNISVYHYATLKGATTQTAGNTQAKNEADYFASVAKSYGLPSNTVMVMDCEQPYKDSNGNVIGPNPNTVDWATAAAQFASELKTQGYANTKFYTSLSWVGTDTASVQMNYNTLGGAKNMWVAQYLYDTPTTNSGWATATTNNSKFGAWQYTSQMHFQGTANLKANFLDTSVEYSNIFNETNPFVPNIAIKFVNLDFKNSGMPFLDSISSEFKNDIQWVYNVGVTTGFTPTTYQPNSSVTRGQMAAFLYRMVNLPPFTPNLLQTSQITDIASSEFRNQILWLLSTGVSNGTTQTSYSPNIPIVYSPNSSVTRGQMAAFLHRYAIAMGLALSGQSYTSSFTDIASSEFANDIGWLKSLGITTGYNPTTYNPSYPVSRGQMAAFLHRFYTVFGGK